MNIFEYIITLLAQSDFWEQLYGNSDYSLDYFNTNHTHSLVLITNLITIYIATRLLYGVLKHSYVDSYTGQEEDDGTKIFYTITGLFFYVLLIVMAILFMPFIMYIYLLITIIYIALIIMNPQKYYNKYIKPLSKKEEKKIVVKKVKKLTKIEIYKQSLLNK